MAVPRRLEPLLPEQPLEKVGEAVREPEADVLLKKRRTTRYEELATFHLNVGLQNFLDPSLNSILK